MSIFAKSKKKASSRRQIAIEGVREGILILPNHHYRLVLQVSAINFELKSEEEQDALIDTFQSFLNSLATPMQLLVRIRELDMDKYVSGFRNRKQADQEAIYEQQTENYIEFVQSLVSSNKILSRHFYVILPHNEADDFEVVSERLNQTADIVAKGLSRLGMQSRQLDSLELLDLFYSSYNPALAKRQPLSQQTLQLLTESYL